MIRTFPSLPRLNKFLRESDNIVKAVMICGNEYAVEIKDSVSTANIGCKTEGDPVADWESLQELASYIRDPELLAEPVLMPGIPPR